RPANGITGTTHAVEAVADTAAVIDPGAPIAVIHAAAIGHGIATPGTAIQVLVVEIRQQGLCVRPGPIPALDDRDRKDDKYGRTRRVTKVRIVIEASDGAVVDSTGGLVAPAGTVPAQPGAVVAYSPAVIGDRAMHASEVFRCAG